MSEEVGSRKSERRRAAIAARRDVPVHLRELLSRDIALRLSALDIFARAQVVGLYAPMGAEVGTAELAREASRAGKVLVWPRLVPGERAMAWAACQPAELVPGSLGALQPPLTATALSPSRLELVVVPGVAFDLACRRLGRGKGHYDATLALLSPAARRVGLAFEAQLVDEVPVEAHDAPLDAVVTEARVVRRADASR